LRQTAREAGGRTSANSASTLGAGRKAGCKDGLAVRPNLSTKVSSAEEGTLREPERSVAL
jgi:hypothetical protein